MGTVTVLLLSLLCIDKPSSDVKIYVDGYIEINHRWNEDNGKLVLDQILIWEWDNDYFIYKVKHWENIKDGRVYDRETPWEYYFDFKELLCFIKHDETKKDVAMHLATLLANSNRNKMDNELKKLKFVEASKYAKDKNINIEDVVVYAWHDCVGSRIIKPQFNFKTGLYEVVVPSEFGYCNFVFSARRLIETNTLFDPETEYKQRFNVPFGYTKLNIRNFQKK